MSSIAVVAAMLTIMIVPARAAARAVASSPSAWASRWNAVGATRIGIDDGVPSSVDGSGRACRCRAGPAGSSRSFWNADSFSATVISSCAPPAK